MGLFVRHQMGQQVGQHSAGWSKSPDTIFNGSTIQKDLTKFTSTAGYATDFGSNVTTGQDNYVYLRGLDTDNTAQGSHMFFYYTESDLMLFPKNWRSDHITVNGSNQNWSSLGPRDPSSKVTVTQNAFIWTPPDLKGSRYDHYCTISWADNNPNTPTPPDLSKFSQFNSCDDLAVFVQSHTNMGWRNTCDVPGSAPDYSYNSRITIPSEGALINLSISFPGYPLDGTFNVNLQGTDSSNSIAESDLRLQDYQGGFNVSNLSYPSSPTDYPLSLRVLWFKGQTSPPKGATPVINVNQYTTPALIQRMNKAGIRTDAIRVQLFEATYCRPGQKPSPSQPTPVVLLGQQTWTIT